MSVDWEIVVNSSWGQGLVVSLEGGKRTETFINSEKNWFLAKELQLVDTWPEFANKTPGLGDLLIVMKEWKNKDFAINIAQFPKGNWEYARLIIE